MVQNIAALHLGLDEAQVRVVCKDVGGSFGIKVHIYADEMATMALSKLLRRPVKFVADRVESFNTDIHARDHICKARIGVSKNGTINAFEIDDVTGIGPYSMYPRTSAIEANQVVNLVGGPQDAELSRSHARGFPEQERHLPVTYRFDYAWSIRQRNGSVWIRWKFAGEISLPMTLILADLRQVSSSKHCRIMRRSTS
jgi:CO/xanthine dehydrogenase Mo-binding subunit